MTTFYTSPSFLLSPLPLLFCCMPSTPGHSAFGVVSWKAYPSAAARANFARISTVHSKPPTLFASTPNMGNSSAGNASQSPPAGGGSSHDGNGIKSKPVGDPLELIRALKADLKTIESAASFLRRIENDVEACAERSNRLAYIHDLGSMIEGEEFHFGMPSAIDVLYRGMQITDSLTSYITPRGFTETVFHDVYNTTRTSFNASVNYEKELFKNHALTPALQTKIAYIHSVFGRKGCYYYVLNDILGGKKPNVLMTTMTMLNVIKRYGALGLESERADAMQFVAEVAKTHGLEGDVFAWALAGATGWIRTSSALLRSVKDETGIFENTVRMCDIAWSSSARGLYLFSPHLFGIIAAEFSANGFQELSARYATRAAEEEKIARGLSLYEALTV